MNQKSVKIQKTESLLLELINGALSRLDDSRLSLLNITSVDCSKGKYDAYAYIEASDIPKNERTIIESRLKKVNGFISKEILASTGWFRAPKIHFKFDDSLNNIKRLDDIFKQIEKEKKHHHDTE